MTDRLGSLSVFVQAAEQRSFTAAGKKLGLSSSAVGKAIARLEERLGVTLFHRTTRSITLTGEGDTFLIRCYRIFEELDAAEAEMAERSSQPRGKLKVSMPLAAELLAPALASFSRLHPGMELDLEFSDRNVDIVEEGFDVVLRIGDEADSRLKTKVIGDFGFVIVGSPDYLSFRGTPSKAEDLFSHACLRSRRGTTGKMQPWRFEMVGGLHDLEVTATAVVNSVAPLITLAQHGAGLACVPTFAVNRQLQSGTLVRVLPELRSEVRTFRLLWPAARHSSPKVRAFVDHLGALLAADLSQDVGRDKTQDV